MKVYLEPIQKEVDEQMQKINDKLLNLYISNSKDMRKCPASGCDGAGFIRLKACRENLVCEICSHEWREYGQSTFCEKVSMTIKGMFSLNGESFTNFRKLMKGEPCPNCGIVIDKDGGCSHMVC